MSFFTEQAARQTAELIEANELKALQKRATAAQAKVVKTALRLDFAGARQSFGELIDARIELSFCRIGKSLRE